jgi:para-nitrobenzyl esterase
VQVVAPLSPAQQQLSNAMIDYWTHFAKTGNPNSHGTRVWSPYDRLVDKFQSETSNYRVYAGRGGILATLRIG